MSPAGSPLTVQLQVPPVTVTGPTVAEVLTVTVGVAPDSTVPVMVWAEPVFAGVVAETERDGGVLSRVISAFFDSNESHHVNGSHGAMIDAFHEAEDHRAPSGNVGTSTPSSFTK